MCNEHHILYTCRHVEEIIRPCSVVGHTTIIQEMVTQVLSHCPDCINEPDFPTREQRNSIPMPTLDRLMAALKLWDRLHYLFVEEFVVEDEGGALRTNDSDHPISQLALPKEDLDQMYDWLTLLQQSRRVPDAWENEMEDQGRTENWDKQLMLQVLRIIVNNEIARREALPQGTPYLLTKVELADLANDEQECSICRADLGQSSYPGVKPEFPVQLPCRHVFGFACLTTAFRELGWRCPLCARPYDSNQFILRCPPEAIPSPWWMGWLKRPFEENP